MTTTTRNEAAERLRVGMYWNDGTDDYLRDIDEAFAAERRATVERIRTLVADPNEDHDLRAGIAAILDEEAAR